MTEGVVDRLEPVEVDEYDGEGAVRGLGVDERAVEVLEQHRPIGQTGEAVVPRQVHQLFMRAASKGPIRTHQQERRRNICQDLCDVALPGTPRPRCEPVQIQYPPTGSAAHQWNGQHRGDAHPGCDVGELWPPVQLFRMIDHHR